MNGLALCSGLGGLELGVRLAIGPSYTTIGYVEREAYCAEVLAARMEEHTIARAPVWDNIESFDGTAFRGTVDILTAGLPCQPYSVAGKKLGHADERALWPHFVRIVEEVKPTVVFLENVTGFLQYFGPVFDELSDLGFIFAPPGIYTASECGAPHLRRRLFVLATHPLRVTQWDGEQWESGGQQNGVRNQGLALVGDDDSEYANTDSEGLQRRSMSRRERPEQRTSGSGGSETANPDRNRRRKRPDQFALPFSQEDTDANSARLLQQRWEKRSWKQGKRGNEFDRLRPSWRLIGDKLRGGEEGTPWATESPLLRMATGMAGRPRQLRAIGGGVVPAVAGRAFRELSIELGLDYD